MSYPAAGEITDVSANASSSWRTVQIAERGDDLFEQRSIVIGHQARFSKPIQFARPPRKLPIHTPPVRRNGASPRPLSSVNLQSIRVVRVEPFLVSFPIVAAGNREFDVARNASGCPRSSPRRSGHRMLDDDAMLLPFQDSSFAFPVGMDVHHHCRWRLGSTPK